MVGMLGACSTSQPEEVESEETVRIVGMTLEEWQNIIDEPMDIDTTFAFVAQQMPGFGGYYLEGNRYVVVRSPVPEGGVSLPADTPYPNLEDAIPIMDRSSVNVHGMLKLMLGDDFPGFVFKDADYDARQMYHWKVTASSLMFSNHVNLISVDFKESLNKIVVGTSATTQEEAANIRRILTDAGIPSEALIIRRGGTIVPLSETR